MPVVMTGSIALLINAFLSDFPAEFGWTQITEIFQWLITINGLIYNGSLAIVSLVFIFALGYNIAKVYETDKLSGGLVALASFIISLGTSMTQTFQLSGIESHFAEIINNITGLSYANNQLSVTISGLIPGNQINSRGYFTAIIIGFLAVIIFSKCMQKKWTIKLPSSVPPAIAVPFTSIIPAFIAMYVVAIVTYIFNQVTGQLIIDWIYNVLQTPLLGLSQNPLSIIMVAFLTQLFWFFWYSWWKCYGTNYGRCLWSCSFSEFRGLSIRKRYSLFMDKCLLWSFCLVCYTRTFDCYILAI